MLLWETVTDLRSGAEALRRGRYGVIEVVDGRLQAVHLRPWPKWISIGAVVWQTWFGRGGRRDRCLVYYDQPLRYPNFLAVKYAYSTLGTTYRTIRAAAVALDQIARIKGSDALLCEAWNSRISDRLLRRWGWERHVPGSSRRHYIKRFYGEYPAYAEIDAFCDENEPVLTAS